MSARSRHALYRAVNRIVRAPSMRIRVGEAVAAALVVRLIELETFVEVAVGDGGALAAFIDD
jgi:hypothetical protein